MPAAKVQLPIYLPQWLYKPLRWMKHALIAADKNGLDLRGDRDVEWSFIAAELPPSPGDALDFGCGTGNLSLLAAQRGFRVMAMDLEPQVFYWRHPAVQFVQGDLLALALPEDFFDLVLNCSSVEHVGLVGRYGVLASRGDGDLEAMQRLRALMKPRATMLLTIPCGKDSVVAPWHRVYGAQRLPLLLSGYSVEKQVFWKKHATNCWTICEQSEALAFQPVRDLKDASPSIYALGCFVLRKPGA